MTRAIDDIAWERRRQVEQEGCSDRADDSYTAGQLAAAAQSYVLAVMARRSPETALRYEGSNRPMPPRCWPFPPHWWRPKDDRRDLVRAGALAVAEIDRVYRLAGSVGPDPIPAVHKWLLDHQAGPARRVDTGYIMTAAIGLLQLQRKRCAGESPRDAGVTVPAPAGGWPMDLRPWFSNGEIPDLVEAAALIALCVVRLDERSGAA